MIFGNKADFDFDIVNLSVISIFYVFSTFGQIRVDISKGTLLSLDIFAGKVGEPTGILSECQKIIMDVKDRQLHLS